MNRIRTISFSTPVRLGGRFSRFRTNRRRAGSHCAPNEEPDALRPGPRFHPCAGNNTPIPTNTALHARSNPRPTRAPPAPAIPAGAAKPRCDHIRMRRRRSESWSDASRAPTERSPRWLVSASTTGSMRTGLHPIQWARRSASRSGRGLQPASSLGRDCEFAAKPGSSPSA